LNWKSGTNYQFYNHKWGNSISLKQWPFWSTPLTLLIVCLLASPSYPGNEDEFEEYIVKIPNLVLNKVQSLDGKSQATLVSEYLNLADDVYLNNIFSEAETELNQWYIIRKKKSAFLDLQKFQATQQIEYFQKNNHFKIYDASPPNDPLYSEQWYHQKVKSIQAWENYDPNPDIIIAIIDTGIDYLHPDLQGSLWINTTEDLNQNGLLDSSDVNGVDDDDNGYVDDVIGWDFTDAPRFPDNGDFEIPDNVPMDEFFQGHGTQIAGIISAQTNNETGIAGLVPGLRVMNIRAGTASGYLEEDDVAKAIIYAVNNGARVINMSFGDVVASSFLQDVIKYAYDQGVVMVAAAGNSGSNELHYPSAFAETISVGSSTENDALASFSNWGQTIDLVAPGADIYATAINNEYNIVQGTSFSAPIVTAAAGLLLSNRPRFSNEQVRNTLKSTSYDLGARGWDELFGAGRLNMYQTALIENESSLIIHHPLSGSSTADNEIHVVITAQDADLKSVSLQYGFGDNPQNWETLVGNHPYQVIKDTLTTLSLTSLQDTSLILRLREEKWDGQQSEYRSILWIDKTPPIISNVTINKFYSGYENAAFIEFYTDDLSNAKLFYRSSQQSLFSVKNLDYQNTEHKILLAASEVSGEIQFYLETINLSGLQQTSDIYSTTIDSETIPLADFQKISWSFPAGFVLPDAIDFDLDGRNEVVLSRYDINNAFGPVEIYEFIDDHFEMQAQTSFPAIPRAYGDVDGDGKLELLLGFGRISYLLEAPEINEFPSQVVWSDTLDFWASQITDLDDDGKGEIIGRTGQVYKILESSGNNKFDEKFTFTNTSEGDNNLGPPKTVITDLDGDLKKELIFGDYDGDVLIFENVANDDYRLRYTFRLPFSDATDYLITAKLRDDGSTALIAGTYSDYGSEYEHQFDATYWVFTVITALGDNVYQEEEKINIFGYFDIKKFDSGFGSIHYNSDDVDLLVLAPYPNLYIFKYMGEQLHPLWFIPGVRTNNIVYNDFDKNGNPELYFNDGSQFTAIEFIEIERPKIPTRFFVYPINETAIQLGWEAVQDADKYIIYRGLNRSQIVKYDSTTITTTYIDSSVIVNTDYYYAIQTVDYGFSIPTSKMSPIIEAMPNSPPVVDSLIVLNDRQCNIYFNEKMKNTTLLAENFYILSMDQLASSAIPFLNENAVLISFSHAFVAGELLQISLNKLRDVFGTPLNEDSHLLDFFYEPDQISPYIENWRLIDRLNLEINFNMPMDKSTVLNVDNYEVEPSGRVTEIESVDDLGKKYKLILTNDTYVGATGVTAYLFCRNLKSVSGSVFNHGNRLNLTHSADNLADLIIYPQPLKIGSDRLIFANIPSQTKINIFDIHGRSVISLEEVDFNGGVRWDLRNKAGIKVAAGIYLFIAESKDDKKIGKFTIVK